MVLFIDTNVLIDFLAKRDSFQSAVDKKAIPLQNCCGIA